MKKTLVLMMVLAGFMAEPLFAHDGTLDAYGDAGQRIRRGRGHDRDKEAILNGDIIQGVYGRGFNGTSFTSSDGVSIELQANEDWTTTANGTKILFKTTPDGSTTQATVMTIDDDGNVTHTGTMNTTGLTTVSSITVTNQQLWGATTAISTFTPTALTLDDGVTLTNNGTTTLTGATNLGDANTDVITVNGLLTLDSAGDIRGAVVPTAVGQLFYNTGTPGEICVSTATNSSAWVQVDDATSACSQ